ncbi:hypothetical protein F5X99DRAFT_366885 [Biscogniauxia marginata]|nr:hypothetical protein F5X99DRAFT_366885 [Biscogniauxia marginata]
MKTASSFARSFTPHRASHFQPQTRLTHTYFPLMSAINGQQPPASAQAGAADKKKTVSIPKGRKEVKILMLHGMSPIAIARS